MSRRTLRAGETLFREHDPGRSAYLIESGAIRIVVGQGESAMTLADLGAGDLVGEMAMIDDAPRTATAIAIEDAVLLVIDREHLAERVAQTDPVVRALLGGQLKRYRAMLATMRGLDAPETIADAEDIAAIGKIRLESQLRDALIGRRLEMHLQPLYEVTQQHVAGYEALIRWNHPERGPISPAEFIALAEETSLIVPVGEYMLQQAIDALVAMRQRGIGPLPFVSINVSPRQLREAGLIQALIDLLQAAELPTSAVKLEITESQVLDYAKVADVLSACREAGIRVALDDFGTGFSNLSHLNELRFDTVKIDQAFARGIESGGRGMAMLEAIVSLVRAIGADALVEGIETPAQLEALRSLGVRYAQGYLIGKPLPLAQVLGDDAPLR
ncbi:EAL domain-containing protein [Xanthomonadaceae bacterium JHOS43]|nr:EAL domain-containing protein [Xanthomonadaceae bacterium JHOS43]MCX7563070.1 EAL domain-containing protein [Xanthomonadaceae bacterium XH05]